MLEKLAKLVFKFPKTTIIIIVLLTVFFYYGLTKITVNTDDKDILPQDDPKVIAFYEADSTFGGAEFVLVILDMDEVFTTKALQEIDDLTLNLEMIKGVNSVMSITNIEEIKGIKDGIEVVELIEDIPYKKAELLKLKKRVLSDDNYAGRIVSENGKIALVMVQLLPNSDTERIVDDVREVIHKHGIEDKVHLSGEPMFDYEMDKILVEDMSKLIPIAMLVMIFILYFSFRSVRGVVLPILIVIITVIWTSGLMGHIGVPISAIGNIMPIILISMGIADGIHILARYREELASGANKRKALYITIIAVGLACFLTSVTTMVGFGSLYTSSLRSIKNFGLFTGIGIAFAFIITVTFFLAILSILRPKKRDLNKKKKVLLGSFLKKWADFIVNRSKAVLSFTVLLILLAGIGIIFISTETNFITFFNPKSAVRKSYDIMKENFGGVEFIQVVVKGNIQDPEILKAMENFQDEIDKIDVLSKPTSIVNYLKNTNKALNEGNPRYEILPKTEEEVAQFLLLLSMGGSDELDNILSFDYDQALIQARMSSFKSSDRDRMIAQVEKAIDKHFGKEKEVILTGQPVLSQTMEKLMVRGQLQSLTLAIFLVFIIMILLSRSITYGAFTTIPITLTVILNFGIMGWFKIPLDVASAVLASIVIGIGIDYAIHFFSRYKEELEIGKSVEQALKITISNTGQAIFYNALAIGLGFLVLIFASMPPLRRFGLLIALTMLFSSTASMTVLPALLFLKDRKLPQTNTEKHRRKN
jgi:predicted RND superfamily exporter protein